MIKLLIVLLIFNNININGIIEDVTSIYNYVYNCYNLKVEQIYNTTEEIEIKSL